MKRPNGNAGKELANLAIRKIAKDNGIPFLDLLARTVELDLWTKLSDAYNEGKETKELLNKIKNLWNLSN